MRVLLSCLLVGFVASTVFSAPDVHTDAGLIQGSTLPAHETGKLFHAYYGIPFAQPPVGDLRFEPPVPFEGSDPESRINSDVIKPMCAQPPGIIAYNISEDCLYLNVFTPAVDGDEFDVRARKKVIMYLHGGGFTIGDTYSFPASNWVTDFDVIVVVTTYRLGALGFLSSGDDALPGNMGLLDQIMALRWLKENIKLFGGDRKDITIFGTSAGAASASLLALSPLTKGLFNKVAMDGGNALAPWAIETHYEDTFYLLTEKAHCFPADFDLSCKQKRNRVKCPKPTEYHRQIVECLRQLDAEDLVLLLADETRTSEEDVLSMEGYISFAPVVDGFVIPRDPFQLMEDHTYLSEVGTLDRKYMIGFANNEAMLFVFGSLLGQVVSFDALLNPDHEVAQEIIRNNLRSVLPCPATQEVLDIASLLYYYPRNAFGYSDLQSTLDFMSDVDFVIPVIHYARALVKASSEVDVFLFVFDHFPEITVPSFPFTGSTHSLSAAYAFDTTSPLVPFIFYANITSTADDNFPLFNVYRGMLSNLAKEGNPSLPGVVQWPTYDRVNESYMSISPQPEVRQQVFNNRVSMWTDFLPTVLDTVFSRGAGRAPYPL